MASQAAPDLVEQLDSFDSAVRRQALERLAARSARGPSVPARPEVNLHYHTSLSYNAYGYSPSRIAWEAHRYGMEVAGIVDFDVLDGLEEFLGAGKLLRLKSVAGFETRVFVKEYGDKVTNSPHEPGVAYFITTGFTSRPEPGTPAAETLTAMRGCAQSRNRKMLDRVNEYLDQVTIDYEEDVLPLTPAGNATERHMLVACERRARELFRNERELARFWSEKLGEPEQAVRALLPDVVALKSLIRAKLMKHGGVGYAAPEEGSFPVLDEVLDMTLSCGAVPSGGWLDGTNDGEKDPVWLFELWRDKGIPTVTVIPDRNWNLEDPDEKALKVEKLNEALQAAVRLHMPVLVGTEMNAYGQKFVDTFSTPELAPYRQVFLDGAHFAWGHALLKASAGVGCAGPWAQAQFGGDAVRRNEFFQRVGRVPCPEEDTVRKLAGLGPEAAPEDFLRLLEA